MSTMFVVVTYSTSRIAAHTLSYWQRANRFIRQRYCNGSYDWHYTNRYQECLRCCVHASLHVKDSTSRFSSLKPSKSWISAASNINLSKEQLYPKRQLRGITSLTWCVFDSRRHHFQCSFSQPDREQSWRNEPMAPNHCCEQEARKEVFARWANGRYDAEIVKGSHLRGRGL